MDLAPFLPVHFVVEDQDQENTDDVLNLVQTEDAFQNQLLNAYNALLREAKSVLTPEGQPPPIYSQINDLDCSPHLQLCNNEIIRPYSRYSFHVYLQHIADTCSNILKVTPDQKVSIGNHMCPPHTQDHPLRIKKAAISFSIVPSGPDKDREKTTSVKIGI